MKDHELVLEQVSASDNVISKHYLFLAFKRFFDITMSIIGIIPLLLLCIVVKIAYMVTGDFNKILLSQERIGKNGRHFKFYKFRTMVPKADEMLEEILKNDSVLAAEYEQHKKLENDPRVTKMGGILRKTSFDELPQIINVFLGEMSLIGNRPYLPREKRDMGKYYNEIIKTKPGITGYWQTSGRNNLTFKERLKLESYYSNHMTFRLDVKIFFKTIIKVIRKEGAK